MSGKGIIYKITNTKTGMVYIGQTTMTMRDRWRLHCSDNSTCGLLREAIRQYGKDSFVMEQVDTGQNRDELNQKEKAWISKENSMFPNGYNIDSGGYYVEYTEASRQKMSANHADVSRENNPMFGRHHSEETRQLIAERLRGKYIGKDSAFHKAVINLDTGEKFDTATEAAKKYGVTVSTLTKTCRGVQKRTAGYRWAFANEEVMPNAEKRR